MFTFAVVGMGARGRKYTGLLLARGAKLTAVCDCDPLIRDYSLKTYGNVALYPDYQSFFASGKLADLLIISTSDSEHIKSALPALELGYDLLLEKPVSPDKEDCLKIYNKAKEKGRRVVICHVLRYSPFFDTIKQELQSGVYGDIVNIEHTENVGWWHQAHSFVRGNWRNEKESSFMLLAKCCHDLDMIAYLSGKKCKTVTSMGSLSYFKADNAPSGAADFCYECKVKDCPYNALEWYVKNPLWVKLPELPEEKRAEFIVNWLSDKTNPYARCVFHCDNDVVDHQVVNMLFQDDSTATLTMTAFTDKFYRRTHVFCTKGEIYGDMLEKKLYCNVFGKSSKVIDLASAFADSHGGGDQGLIDDLCDIMNGSERSSRTDLKASLTSHMMAFAAEKSRKNGGSPEQVDNSFDKE